MDVSSVDAGLFDCLQINLAVLASHYHGAATPYRLGAELHFNPRSRQNSLPTVEPSLGQQLEAADERLGLASIQRVDTASAHEALGSDVPVYLITDAAYLPWLPYYRQKHVEHSFLLEPAGDGVWIIDGYRNETIWGPAEPCRFKRDRSAVVDLIRTLPDLSAIWFEPRPLPAPPPLSFEMSRQSLRSYLSTYAEHPDRETALDRFSLEIWLLHRSRRLHTRYRCEFRGDVSPAVRTHLQEWSKMVARVYLAYRRVAQGRPEPPGLFTAVGNLLGEDGSVFVPESPVSDGTDVHAGVRATVATVLGLPEQLVEQGELTNLPAFSSLRMIEIVERLERVFAVEFPPGSLLPEKLVRVDDLCELVRDARRQAV
ncbi:phosphopantetheine-binding protein [Amycolatopsis acidiphila]|uniref:Acyl carrier protein n=1 Tax=Amycolatopsis acidiphila TaxID=715473 RepID=A0A558AHC3_9PSEU|nr:acyl carrier protein [Amycolatopsis acidiphila]TVT23646.1 acyl carrier protein [Amycolatopsis acidiphila]UIJ58636.1 phosphopantetheine-binding protein [Amycolatopsis acidiphila]GHG76325.1 hypothetical protein GCM10017788_41760 [Amycolatopsis acidiphila]